MVEWNHCALSNARILEPNEYYEIVIFERERSRARQQNYPLSFKSPHYAQSVDHLHTDQHAAVVLDWHSTVW